MTSAEYRLLVNGKRCVCCGHPLSSERTGFTGDKYGWHITDYFCRVTVLIYCPNNSCNHAMGMSDLGISEASPEPQQVM